MRYSNRTAFFNQIKNAKTAGAASRTYWVAVSGDYERAEITKELLELAIPSSANVQKWSELNLSSLGSHLQTQGLFGDEPVALVENAEAIVQSDGTTLRPLFPRQFGYLVFCAKSKSVASSWVENEGVVLDLLAEKPWDKEKRIQQTLEGRVLKAQKTIASGALHALMSSQEMDEGILEREVEKLIAYSGSKAHITLEDVEAICTPNRTVNAWQMAEKVVWEKKGSLEEAQFHVLVPALRSQLQLGLKIATLLQENGSPEEWSAALPKVFPKTLEKRTQEASRLGVSYFALGLKTLFEIELMSRSETQNLGALLDLFQCTLYQTPS